MKHIKNVRPVDKYDENWNYISSYRSMTDALNDNPGASKTMIQLCLKFPEKFSGGFHWKDHEEHNKS